MIWKAFKTKAKGKNPSYNIKRVGGGCVAKINSSMVEGNEANAKLIAAAPDMLEALKKISNDEVTHTKLNQQRLCCKFQDIAQAAINKATT